MGALPTLSTVIWLPILAGIVILFTGSDRNAGMASAYFEGSEHAATISEAMQEPLLKQVESPDFDEGAEVDGLVDRFRRARLGRRKEQLVELMRAGTATAADEAVYRDLQARLAMARSGTPSAEAGSKL